MEKRHVVYGIVFIAVFTLGTLNVMTDGRFSHALSSKIPGHSAEASVTPEIEIKDNLSLEANETGEINAVIRNSDKVSYTITGNTPRTSLNPDFRPSPSAGQDSMPPTWIWDHPEKEINLVINFNSSELGTGEHRFSLEAYNSDSKTVEKEFSVTVS